MSLGPGPGFEAAAGRNTIPLGNSWGTTRFSLRWLFNAVIPVSIVERWYGDLDGSLFGLTTGTGGTIGERPAVEFVSFERDWQLHALNFTYPVMETTGATGGSTWYRITANLFTPAGGFDAVQNNTVGPFGPQLVTVPGGDQGTVRGFGGTNPVNHPQGEGWIVANDSLRVDLFGTTVANQISDAAGRGYLGGGSPLIRPFHWDKKSMNQITFPRPIRILRGRQLVLQLEMADDTASYVPNHSLLCSIMYSELPNPSGSFQTGGP